MEKMLIAMFIGIILTKAIARACTRHFFSDRMSPVMLMYNAKIYQSGSTENKTWMTFNLETGYITDVGTKDPPLGRFPDELRKDCGGRRILPGLHDSHLHLEKYGDFPKLLNLHGCDSIKRFQEMIVGYRKSNPGRKWIVGIAWEQDILSRYPTKDDIDEVCQDIPVFLYRVCGHVAVVNSRALSVAGITEDTPDPHGGVVERYPSGHKDQGKLTGILKERAMELVTPFIPEASDEKKNNIKSAIQELLRTGVTSAHACEHDTWNEFASLAADDQLPIRIFFSAYFEHRKEDNFPVAGQVQGPMLSCDRVKLFADGSLGAATAALSEPYRHSDNRGILYYPRDELVALIREATGLGFRLEIHVIGDAAAEEVLVALEKANVAPEKRPILTHCQILRADLLRRMKERGVIANIQPQFVTTDARSTVPQLLPSALMSHAYPWKTLLDKGIACAGGSDAPIEQPHPLLGIYDAVFRKIGSRDPNNTNVFRPEECLSVSQAIDLYTKGGAYAAMREHQLGQLLPGYQADFVIIDKDVCSDPVHLLSSKVLEVWVAGKRRL